MFREAVNRKSENAIGAWSFWLDIDVGEKKAKEGKGYATLDEAVEALHEFCRTTGLPKPSLFICSGYGLHIYWLMNEFVPRERWLKAARTLKVLCKAHEFLADEHRTADIASVLRPVGTRNYKNPDDPQPVTVLHPPEGKEPKRIDLAKFEVALDAAAQVLRQAKADSQTGAAPKRLGSAPAALLDGLNEARQAAMIAAPVNIAPPDLPPPETPEEIEKVKAMLATIKPDCDRVAWRQVVWSILARGWACGEKLARDWSQRGSKWNKSDFDGVVHSFKPDGGTGFKTLHYYATTPGDWREPTEVAVTGEQGGALDGQIIPPGAASPNGKPMTRDDFNDRFFVAPFGGGTFIFDRMSENLIAEGMTERAFTLRFKNIYDKKGDPENRKSRTLATQWLSWPQRKTYEPFAKLPQLGAATAFLVSAETLCRWIFLPDAVNP